MSVVSVLYKCRVYGEVWYVWCVWCVCGMCVVCMVWCGMCVPCGVSLARMVCGLLTLIKIFGVTSL